MSNFVTQLLIAKFHHVAPGRLGCSVRVMSAIFHEVMLFTARRLRGDLRLVVAFRVRHLNPFTQLLST